MREAKDLWEPTNLHGNITVNPGDDVQAAISRIIRKFPLPVYTDIQIHRHPNQDGTISIFFELVD